MVKTLAVCAGLLVAVSAVLGDTPQVAAPALKPAVVAKTLSSLLGQEIGSGRVLRITLKPSGAKPAETMLATVQGRTETQFFISRVHFRAYRIYPAGQPNPGGFMGDAAPDAAIIAMGEETGAPLATYPYPDKDALNLLETDPARFQARKIFCTFDTAAPIVPSDVVRLEWLRLPASSLPQLSRPVRNATPPRINPSFAPLWP